MLATSEWFSPKKLYHVLYCNSKCIYLLLYVKQAGKNNSEVARACANFGVSDLRVVHPGKLQAALGRAHRSEEKDETL